MFREDVSESSVILNKNDSSLVLINRHSRRFFWGEIVNCTQGIMLSEITNSECAVFVYC